MYHIFLFLKNNSIFLYFSENWLLFSICLCDLFDAVLLEKVSSLFLWSVNAAYLLFLLESLTLLCINSLELFNAQKERGLIIFFISFVLGLHLILKVTIILLTASYSCKRSVFYIMMFSPMRIHHIISAWLGFYSWMSSPLMSGEKLMVQIIVCVVFILGRKELHNSLVEIYRVHTLGEH